MTPPKDYRRLAENLHRNMGRHIRDERDIYPSLERYFEGNVPDTLDVKKLRSAYTDMFPKAGGVRRETGVRALERADIRQEFYRYGRSPDAKASPRFRDTKTGRFVKAVL